MRMTMMIRMVMSLKELLKCTGLPLSIKNIQIVEGGAGGGGGGVGQDCFYNV